MLIGVSAYPNPAADKLYKNLVQDNKLADYFSVNDEIFLLLLIIKGEAFILKDLLVLGVNLLHGQRESEAALWRSLLRGRVLERLPAFQTVG